MASRQSPLHSIMWVSYQQLVYDSYHSLENKLQLKVNKGVRALHKEPVCVLCFLVYELLYRYGPYVTPEDQSRLFCPQCQDVLLVHQHHPFSECDTCQKLARRSKTLFRMYDMQATYNAAKIRPSEIYHTLRGRDCLTCNVKKEIMHYFASFFWQHPDSTCGPCRVLQRNVNDHEYRTCQDCTGLTWERRQVLNFNTLKCVTNAFISSPAILPVSRYLFKLDKNATDKRNKKVKMPCHAHLPAIWEEP